MFRKLKARRLVRKAEMYLAHAKKYGNFEHVPGRGISLVDGGWAIPPSEIDKRSGAAEFYVRASKLYGEADMPREAARYAHRASKLYAESGWKSAAPYELQRGRKYRHEAAIRKLESSHRRRDLSHKVTAGILLLSGAFFFNGGITGNVISDLNSTSSSSIGAFLFLCGLVYLFFVFRNK